MRQSTVIALFLLTVGGMFLALHPTYTARTEQTTEGVEATAPVTEQRPYPDWVGPAAIVAGLLLLLPRARRRQR